MEVRLHNCLEALIQVEQARRRDPFEVRKQRKRPETESAEQFQVAAGTAAAADEPEQKRQNGSGNAVATDKQALVRTVAVGGVQEGFQAAVQQLAAAAGKVWLCQG